MPKLIRNRQIVEDARPVVILEEGETAATIALPEGGAIVPLAVWQARRDELLAHGGFGVWLAGDQEPSDLADDLAQLQTIAIHFPKFADGRGYSLATLLRSRFGYRGELRAIGEVLRDQFNYLVRCGFDALQPAEGRYTDTQLLAALGSIADFSEPYQTSAAVPDPLFRRVRRAA